MPFNGIFTKGVIPYIASLSGTLFGVEIEAEGKNIPRPDFEEGSEDPDDDEPMRNDEFREDLIPERWRPVKEHSLRGEGVEYVFRKPYTLEESLETIDELQQMFIKADSWLNGESTRTSTHIHVNMSDCRAGNIATFLATYLLLEEMLFSVLPPIRQKNLFCLRTRHAPATLLFWRQLFGLNPAGVDNTNLRYSALSVTSLFKYGSLEFRGGQGPSMDPGYWAFIKNLVRFFGNLRETAITNPMPVDFLEKLQARGPHSFYAEYFHPFFGAVAGVSEFRLFERGMVSAMTLVKDIQWNEEPAVLSMFDPSVDAVEAPTLSTLEQTWSEIDALIDSYEPLPTIAVPITPPAQAYWTWETASVSPPSPSYYESILASLPPEESN